METRYVLLVLTGALLVGTYVAEFALAPGDGRLSEGHVQGPEALGWLAEHDGDATFAADRFTEPGQAMQFVRRLYDAGAAHVVVPEESIRGEGDESYADALVVGLPDDPDQRRQVLELCAPEQSRSDAAATTATMEDRLFLFWD